MGLHQLMGSILVIFHLSGLRKYADTAHISYFSTFYPPLLENVLWCQVIGFFSFCTTAITKKVRKKICHNYVDRPVQGYI